MSKRFLAAALACAATVALFLGRDLADLRFTGAGLARSALTNCLFWLCCALLMLLTLRHHSWLRLFSMI